MWSSIFYNKAWEVSDFTPLWGNPGDIKFIQMMLAAKGYFISQEWMNIMTFKLGIQQVFTCCGLPSMDWVGLVHDRNRKASRLYGLKKNEVICTCRMVCNISYMVYEDIICIYHDTLFMMLTLSLIRLMSMWDRNIASGVAGHESTKAPTTRGGDATNLVLNLKCLYSWFFAKHLLRCCATMGASDRCQWVNAMLGDSVRLHHGVALKG